MKWLLVSCALIFISSQTEAFSPKEIKDKFLEEEIVPDVLADLPEIKPLKITYPSGINVSLGNILTPTQVKDVPKVEFEAEEGAYYTLLMTGKLRNKISFFKKLHFNLFTDPDAPSRKEPTSREFRHWLMINILGSDLSSGEGLQYFFLNSLFAIFFLLKPFLNTSALDHLRILVYIAMSSCYSSSRMEKLSMSLLSFAFQPPQKISSASLI